MSYQKAFSKSEYSTRVIRTKECMRDVWCGLVVID